MARFRIHGAGRPPAALVYGRVLRLTLGDHGALPYGPRGSESIFENVTRVKYERTTTCEGRRFRSFRKSGDQDTKWSSTSPRWVQIPDLGFLNRRVDGSRQALSGEDRPRAPCRWIRYITGATAISRHGVHHDALWGAKGDSSEGPC